MDISRIKHLAEVGSITQTQLVEYYENHPEELQKLTESDLFGLGIVTRVDDQEVKDSISDPAYSVYKITADFDGKLKTGVEKAINITLAPVSVSTKGYNKCQFAFDSIRPEGAKMTFKATDSLSQEITFENSGVWGPEEGFPVGPDYSATTEFKITVDKPGQYAVVVKLQDKELGVEVCSAVFNAEATDLVPSVYKISSDAESQKFVAGQETTTNVNIQSIQVGDKGYDKVRFYFTSERPAEAKVTFKATDTNHEEFTFENGGVWGPPGGFPLPAEYDVTEPFKVTPSAEGHYKVSVQLKNETDASVICEYSYEFDAAPAEDSEIVVDDGE